MSQSDGGQFERSEADCVQGALRHQTSQSRAEWILPDAGDGSKLDKLPSPALIQLLPVDTPDLPTGISVTSTTNTD